MAGVPAEDLSGVFAPCYLEAEKSIYEESPFAHVLLRQYSGVFCEYCNKRLPTGSLECTGCGAVEYCNHECQARDWLNHQLECKFLKRLHEKHEDIVRLVGLVHLKQLGGQQTSRVISGNMLGIEVNIMEVEGMFPEDNEFFRHTSYVLTEIYEYLKRYLGVEAPTETEFTKLMKKVNYNTLLKVDDKLNFIACYFFLGITKFSKECIPNTRMEISGNTLKLYPIRDLKQNEQITINSHMNYPKTIVPLDRAYYQCKCTDCSKSVQASTLRKVLNLRKARDVIKESLKLLDELANCWESQLDIISDKVDALLKKQMDILGPNHYLHMRLLAFRRYRMKKETREFVRKLNAAQNEVYGEVHLVGRGLFPFYWTLLPDL